MRPDALPFQPRDRAAYLPTADALVLADLHLGRAEGTPLALPVTASTVERAGALVDHFEPSTVVLAGDVLHSFSEVAPAAARSFEALRERVAPAELVVVAGNHDEHLEDLCTADTSVRLRDDALVCHGHEEPRETAPRYVVGHDHPAIVIEGRRRPCFLYGVGVYRGADVLALPAFDRLARGTPVNRLGPGDPASPLLADLEAFSPVVHDGAADETYVFPPLSASSAYL